MRRGVVLILLCLGVGSLFARSDSTWHVDIGYSGGNIVHPGLTAGAYRVVKRKPLNRANGKVMAKDLLLGARLGFYFHKDYQTAFWLQGELARKKMKSRGRSRTISLGLGGIETWIPNSYLVDQNGSIDYRSGKGIAYFLLSPSIEWAKEISNYQGFISEWYVRPRIQWQFPYFQGTNQYLLIEMGVKLRGSK
ncbi:MAG: hypothetical protein RLN86_12055 [Cyclobacteriaceae bacterium]